jgi:hypothetical protein
MEGSHFRDFCVSAVRFSHGRQQDQSALFCAGGIQSRLQRSAQGFETNPIAPSNIDSNARVLQVSFVASPQHPGSKRSTGSKRGFYKLEALRSSSL